MKKDLTIKGKVVDANGNAMGNVKVEAWDKDLLIDDLLGTAKTNARGMFSLEFNPDYYKELIFDRRPDIYFKVFLGNKCVLESDEILWNADNDERVILQLNLVQDGDNGGGDDGGNDGDDSDDPNYDNRIEVYGTVTASGSVLPDGMVLEVINKLVLENVVLATQKVANDGRYSVKVRVAGKEQPAIQVRVLDHDKKVVGTSSIAYELKRRMKLDVSIDSSLAASLSEYDSIARRIQPYIGKLSPAELNNEQIELLAAKTSLPYSGIARYAAAHRVGGTEKISAEILYAWFYFGVTMDADSIYSYNDAALRSYIGQAVQDNIIGEQKDVDVMNALEGIQRNALQATLDAPTVSGGASYQDILKTTAVKDATIAQFMDLTKRYEGNDPKAFWSDLHNNDNGITAKEVEELKFSVQAGSLAFGHAPLAEGFVRLKKEKVISAIEDLTAWSSGQWDEFLSGNDDQIPSHIPGNSAQQRKQNYIKASQRILEQTYPTKFLSARLNDRQSPIGNDFKQFVRNNQQFEIGETNISNYLAENEGSLEGIKDEQTFVQGLRELQVRYMLSPGFEKYDSIARLEELNVKSSVDVVAQGWKRFSENYVQAGGSTEMAGVVYEMAGHNAAMMQQLQFTYGADMVLGTYVTTIPQYWEWFGNAVTEKDPDLETLFGSQDFCECLHCRSIYSPSAYLVDVLQFLKKADTNTDSFDNTQEVLFDRRPDICSIDLNCDNTNTAMPYIDLINEVFENAIYQKTTGETPDYTVNQTTLTSEELMAHPEHIRPEVYNDTLKNAVYPWNLPLDLWTEEGRVYLNHLNLPRYSVMDRWHAGALYDNLTDNDIAAEVLQLSEIDREILLGTTGASNKALWGLSGGGTLVSILDEPAKVLEQSGLEFEELKSLLKTWFVNPTGTIKIEFDSEDLCDLDKATLKNISEDALMNMLRFVRLRNKLHWTDRELDIALKAFEADTITEDVLIRISHLVRLNTRIKLPMYQMAVLFGQIFPGHVNDKDDERSPYEILFLNKAVLNPVDEAFELNATLTELDDTSEKIGDHTATIKAGTGLSSSDLDLLLAEVLPDDTLNLDNLSILYRYKVLSKAMKLSVEELLTLIDLKGLNPFDAAATENTLRFIDEYVELKSAKFSVAQLEYLLYQNTDLSQGYGLSEAQVSTALTSLQSELKKIVEENQFSDDPQGETTVAKLATLLSEEDLNTSVEILEQTSALTEAEQLTFLIDHWALFLADTTDAGNKLITTAHADFLADKQARYEYLLTDLLAYTISTGTYELLKQRIASNFGLDANVSEELLFTWLSGPDDVSVLTGDVLREESFMNSSNATIEKADFPDQFNTYVLLHKSALILNNFKVTSVELPYLFANAFDPDIAGWAGWFDFGGIPVVADGTPSDLMQQLVRMSRLFAFYHKLPASEENLFELMLDAYDPASATTLAEVLETIATLTNWDLENITELTTNRFGYAKTDFKDELPFLAIAQCMRVVSLTGASAADIADWTSLELASSVSGQIVHTVKSLYEDEQWLGIARPLRDQLREKQRKALVAWLLANQSGIDSEFDLYGYYLIDPEMSACMLTSRMRLAMSSVQLFVQRCLMNLESHVDIENNDLEHWNQWKWMKTYRLWEVNRKIFTYPENWIEPELRDDKTELFKQLEQELAQVEVNDENMEVAYINYLAKLEDISNMDIMGICLAKEGSTSEGYYIFGRTVGDPQMLYYRQYNGDGEWTSWQKIEMDFEGDALVPIMYKGRLHLFWPIFTSKTVAAEIPDADEEGDEAKNYYEIQIAWTSLRNGKWEPKRVTKEKINETQSDSWRDTYSNQWQHEDGGNRFFIAKDIDSDNNLELTVYASEHQYLSLTNNGWPLKQVGGFVFNPSMKVTTVNTTNAELELNIVNQADIIGQEFHESIWYEPYTQPFSLGGTDMLAKTPDDRFSISYVDFNGTPGIGWYPFFYQDNHHTLFIRFDWSAFKYRVEVHDHPYVGDFLNAVNLDGVDGLLNPEYNSNTNSLEYKLRRQQVEEEFFESLYGARTSFIHEDLPVNKINFDFGAAYSIYNWELFYHIPMFIADKLSTNQKFEEAQKWYHYIFDPTDTSTEYSVPQRFWKLKPFVEIYDEAEDGMPASIQELMELLNEGDSEMEAQVDAWREDPFNPHLVARMRITAYQKNVVMRYIDNLLSWADMLFRQDTMETTNEATQLYLLAWYILGDRPNMIEGKERTDKSYCELDEIGIDDFSNAMVTLETKLIRYFGSKYAAGFDKFKNYMDTPSKNYASEKLYAADSLWFEDVPYQAVGVASKAQPQQKRTVNRKMRANDNYLDEVGATATTAQAPDNSIVGQLDVQAHTGTLFEWKDTAYGDLQAFNPNINWTPGGVTTKPHWHYEVQLIKGLYFCIPHNDYLLGYWDRVDDRMYKLRNCLNIDGVFRQLPLFDPPLDPAAIVRAAASGMDLSSALNDLNASLPNYRFDAMIRRAKEFTGVVERAGAALLSVLEKRDAEGLEMLRGKNRVELLDAVRQVKELEIDLAQKNRNALTENLSMAQGKERYYSNKEDINVAEGIQIGLMGGGLTMQIIAQVIQLTAAGTYQIPQLTFGAAGWAGSPVALASYGGQQVGNTASKIADAMNGIAGLLYQGANLSGLIAGFQRRSEDWAFQASQASGEIKLIEEQLEAAKLSYDIALQHLENHDKEVEQAEAEFDYRKSKFTNKELYDWMTGQISAVYFQAYQMAYDLAKRAERSYKFELAESNDSFISYGYWDSLKKGLLAGEKLQTDLMRMEAAYLEKNKRSYELTKNVSLKMIDAYALAQLRENGSCYINIPEELFDIDHPGHYMRRIKSVSITIPCIAGPYTGVNSKLTLLGSQIRKNTEVDPDDSASYPRKTDGSETRFLENMTMIESIATSNGQNDDGLFVLNFQDERYLPFEGAGVISNWLLELPGEFRSFDYTTISDVIVSINYTAKDGGAILRSSAEGNLTTYVETQPDVKLDRLFSVRHEFSNEWHQLLNPQADQDDQTVDIVLKKTHFPYLYQDRIINGMTMDLILQLDDASVYDNSNKASIYLSVDEGAESEAVLTADTSVSSSDYIGGQPVTLGHAVAFSMDEDDVTLTVTFKETNLQSLPAELVVDEDGHKRLNADAINDLLLVCKYHVG